MADKAQSVLDRLKAKARNTGKPFQLLLQLFCQEEFLRRVQRSRYTNNLVLKGGLLLYCLSGFESRPTMDIDFMLRHQSNSLPEVESLVKEIILVDTGNDYVVFDIKSMESIAEHREYNGVRVKMVGRIKNTRTPFDVDMGVGDVVIPRPEIRRIPTQLEDFEEPEIMTYSLESTVAEKFDAIISRMELSSRMKDYYDIFYLANSYRFDARKLQEALFETLQNRGTCYEADTFERIMEFEQDNSMKQKWRQFIKNTVKEDLEFSEVLQIINLFLSPVFSAILNETEAFGLWNPEKLKYKTTGKNRKRCR